MGPVVEMAYWFVKFVGDYNTLYKTAVDASAKKKDQKKEPITKYFFTKSTARLVKFARYLLKYLSNYKKLYKAAERMTTVI